MKRIYNILLIIILFFTIVIFSISASIVDEQRRSVDTMSPNNVYRAANDSVRLFNDSVVENILINIDFVDNHVRGVVVRGECCGVDSVVENKSTISRFFDVERTLKENIWDWIAIILVGLIVFIVIICVVILILYQKKENKQENINAKQKITIQVLLISIIVFVAIYLESHWAYLAIVILCALGVFKCNSDLLKNFIEIFQAIYGKLEIKGMNQKQIEKKVENEFRRVQNGGMLANCGSIRREVLKQDEYVKKYIELEQLALDNLEKQYPNLQKYVQIKTNSKYNFELDGLIEEKDIIYVVDVKYIRSLSDMEHLSQRMVIILDFVARVTGKPTKMLLLIITLKSETRDKILEYFNKQSISDYTPIVKIYTEAELKN